MLLIYFMSRYLYIHIPFCASKCPYCDFVSVPYDGKLAGEYIDALIAELKMRAGELDGPLEGLYIGGGTPTVLPVGMLKGLIGRINEMCGIDEGTEVTVEANPGTVDLDKLGDLRRSGVNRLSIGVQSFDDGVLGSLGRAHTAAEAAAAFGAAREAGFENISIDLIYGVPGQGIQQWDETLKKASGLGAEHISAYELTPEEGTPLHVSIKKGDTRMPDDELVADMYELAVEELGAGGYGHYEISNYARAGFECRHNLNYWRRGTYVGAGAAAHSFDGRSRSGNISDVHGYIKSVRAGDMLPLSHSHELTRDEALKETLMLGLRTALGLDVQGVKEAFGLDIEGASRGLVEGGLMEHQQGRLRLTGRGFGLANSVTVELMRLAGIG